MSLSLELPFDDKVWFGCEFSILQNNGLSFVSWLQMKSVSFWVFDPTLVHLTMKLGCTKFLRPFISYFLPSFFPN